jgi:hypothetical protein
MPSLNDTLRGWIRDNPIRLLSIGVAVLVIGVSLWVGIQARQATKELAQKRAAWKRMSEDLADIRQQFRVPSSTEAAALIAESRQMAALGVPKTDRLALLESIGRLAEACSLLQVRVSATPTDSLIIPPRAIGAQTIGPAGYAVTLEFAGSFAGVVQFVSSLPPSVSVSLLRGARQGAATLYHVVLSVYELDANNAG